LGYDFLKFTEINRMNKAETITIICDNEDCRTPYILSMDTLREVRSVVLTCKSCGDIQKITLGENGSLEICHIR
jgi:RNase P subunit RPR2